MKICTNTHYLFCNFNTDLAVGNLVLGAIVHRKSPIVDTMGLLGLFF